MALAGSSLLVLLLASDDASPPRLRRNVWPGAVTVSPRPAPESVGAPLRTTLFFELEAGSDTKGEVDPIDVATLRVTLTTGDVGGTADRRMRELVRGGDFVAGVASGRLFPSGSSQNPLQPAEPLALYVELAEALPAAAKCEVRIEGRSAAGVALPDGARFGFTTRAAPPPGPSGRPPPVALVGDVARTIHFEHRVFSGILKPNFDSTVLMDQLPTCELMSAVTGPPPHPAVGSLERDWPLCGDYWTNAYFDGDPNLVRERETRLVTAIADAATEGTEGSLDLELSLADLPEGPLYGIDADRPLAPDVSVGCAVLVVDREQSRAATVVAVDELRRAVRVRIRARPQDAGTRERARDWIVPATPEVPADSPATPGHFTQAAAYLKKLEPCGTPCFWFGRLDHEWDLVHGRFGRRLVVGFDRVPCDLSSGGVPGRSTTFKDAVEWHSFVRAITSHLIERYGRSCLDFHWSLFNEPDLAPLFWEGSDEELFAVYDLAVDAILRAFEEHDLPSESVTIGGLELGALAPRPELLEKFLRHCSPRAATATGSSNRALLEPRLEGRRSQRVESLAAAGGGFGSPCDFVSLHEYKHSAFALDQLKWARQRALEIDPDFFARLAVVAFESDPDWLPTRDPATRAMFLGNGWWPAWAADWTRRAIAAAFEDAAFTRHEALLTVWPLDRDRGGIPTLSSVLSPREGAGGNAASVTVAKDILHFLTCLGWMGTDYFRLEPASARDAPDEGRQYFGFGSKAGEDSWVVLVASHDPLDPEQRDARACTVTIELAGLPSEPLVAEHFLVEGERLVGSASDAPVERRDGRARIVIELPASALRCLRIRRAGR